MVNLALEPPGSTPHRPPWRFSKLLAIALLSAVSATAGFVVGRRTANRPLFEALPPSASVQPLRGAPAAPLGAGLPAAAPAAEPPANRLDALPLAPAAGPPADSAAPAAPAAGAGAGASAVGSASWKRLSATLKGPLVQGVAAALPPEDRGVAEELTQMANRLLIWSLQISRDGRKGDRLEMLYLPPGGEQHELLLQAVRYTSLKLGRTFEAVRYRPEGASFARYYQADGSEVEERLLDGPIADYEQVTSLLHDGRHHKGVDFKTPVGSPVTAPFDGEVVRRNWHFAANGNSLEIVDPASGRHAIFLHLESVPSEMQPGTKVRKGELVAHSGNSGHSTAPHLHYQLEGSDGKVLDPFAVHKVHRVALQGAAKVGFDEERTRIEGLLGKG